MLILEIKLETILSTIFLQASSIYISQHAHVQGSKLNWNWKSKWHVFHALECQNEWSEWEHATFHLSTQQHNWYQLCLSTTKIFHQIIHFQLIFEPIVFLFFREKNYEEEEEEETLHLSFVKRAFAKLFSL